MPSPTIRRPLWSPALLSMALLAALLSVDSAKAQFNASSLASTVTDSQAGDGLKEALSHSISAAVTSTGKPGGFLDNPAIKIGMPPKLERVATLMRDAGMGSEVDSLVKNMNAAAEQAAPAAKPILLNALKSMSVSDVRGIVTGGPTAATDYFKRTSSSSIAEALRPIINQQMDKIGVGQQFESLMGKAPSIPFMKTPTVNINDYVLGKAVDGLFVVMGQEETRIRTNPAAQVTPLLKSLFGGR